MRSHGERDGRVHRGQLFDHDDVFDVAEAGAAILLRKNNTQQAQLSQFGHQLGGKMCRLVPLHHVRGDFAGGEFPHSLPQLLLFIGEGKIHALSL